MKLAPLTGFFGTNSSGKSSLLQMLLLLKQTIRTKKVIFFGDENSYVNLGDFQEVIHGHKDEELLELGFACKFPESIKIRISQYGLKPDEVTSDFFSFETAIQKHDSSQTVSRICYDIGGSGVKKIELKGNNIFYQNKRLFAGSYKNCYSIKETTNAFPGSNDFLDLLSAKFEELFSHVYYLGPTRVHPKRCYQWDGIHPKDLNLWGDETIDALLSARVRQLKTSNKESGVPIENRISEWLQRMGFAHFFSLGPSGSLDDNNYEIRIQQSFEGVKVTLADIGYGVAQFLPVLVLCYYVPIGSILILEEPGTHLHPKAQADLADLLIEVIIERNLQILVESHSEHLLTRLQLRIAEEKISANDTAIHFCENENGVSNIKPLEIDDLGNIKNWPKNFFGDVKGDLVKMTREQMKRQQKAEG